jgi:Carboxypeptidase regulatory-like domain
MNHPCLRFITVLLVLLAGATLVFGQVDLGLITGTVMDPAGAMVPNAKVTITNVNNGTVRTSSSDANGLYAVAGLRPDTYSVKIEAAGFATFTQMVQVTVGSRNDMSPHMKIATNSTSIEVVGTGAVAVETQSQEVSQVIDEKQIRNLPTLTRDPYALVATAGNVQRDPNSNSTRGVGFGLNGQREAATNVQLDGTENSDLFAAGVGQTIPLDAMQEFRVITSGLSAEYGRTTGGVVNVSTKSGSNAFHGSVYEWNRTAALAANDYDSNAQGLPKAGFTRNQFGYSIGGPVKKNKLFFFNTTEWTRVRSAANQTIYVPSASFINAAAAHADGANTIAYFAKNQLKTGLRQGSGISTAQMISALGGKFRPCSATQTPGVGSCFTNGTRLTPAAASNPLFFGTANPDGSSNTGLATMNIFDQVSQQVPTDNGGGTPQNTYNTLTRIDFNLTDKTTLTGRYALYSELDFDGSNSNSPYVGYDTGFNAFTNNVMVGLTHVWSPTLLSDSKINFERFNQNQGLGAAGVSPSLYFNAAAAFAVNGVDVALPGYLPYAPGSAIPFGGPQNYAQFGQDFTWTKSKHTIKFGGMFLYVKDNHAFGAFENAVEAFSPSGLGAGLDNFLSGHLAQFQVAVAGQGKFPCSRDAVSNLLVPTADCSLSLPVTSPSFSRSNRFRDGAAYINDSFKLTQRLTLNAGLRWEYYGVQHNNNGDVDSNFYFGSGATIFDRIANGAVKTAPTSELGGLWAPQRKNFAPRLGFAWDIFGDGKTSLRGGFGMGYERNFGNVTFNVIQNPPAQIQITFASPADGTILVSPNNLGQFASGTGSKAIPNASLRAVDPNIKTARSDFWNLSIEREVARNTTFGVTYTGSRGTNLYSIANINRQGAGGSYLQRTDVNGLKPGQCKPDPKDSTNELCYALGAQRMNLQYGNINFRGSDGSSDYHALNTSLRTQNMFNSGASMTFNWTWAHALDNISSTFTDGGANNNNLGFLDPFNPNLDRGDADFDIRHRIALSGTWAIPFAKSMHGFANRILDGWEVSPMITARTGAPFSVFDCTNIAFAVCPRAIFSGANPSTHNPVATGDPNTFNILDLSTVVAGAYADPITGTGEFPTCTDALYTGCAWPTNMSRRNAFRGPGTYNIDLGIVKNFKVTERQGLQFRTELFNAFNHPVLYPVLNGNNDVSVGPTIQAKYGTYNGTTQPNSRRRIQMALKYTF